jgi:hypothetical protein
LQAVADAAEALGTSTETETVNTARYEALENRRRTLALVHLREAAGEDAVDLNLFEDTGIQADCRKYSFADLSIAVDVCRPACPVTLGRPPGRAVASLPGAGTVPLTSNIDINDHGPRWLPTTICGARAHRGPQTHRALIELLKRWLFARYSWTGRSGWLARKII